MKIVSQSSDELVLREGGTSGIVVGAAFIIAGAVGGYFLRETNPYVIWIALAVIAAGIGIVLFSSSITVTANRSTGKLMYQKKRIVGAQNSSHQIADIFRIETRKEWRVQNSPPSGNQNASIPQPQLVAQSVIVFKDGRELPLDHQKPSSTTSIGSMTVMGGQGAETAIASQVAQFLNVPFQEIMPPNIGGGINIQFR